MRNRLVVHLFDVMQNECFAVGIGQLANSHRYLEHQLILGKLGQYAQLRTGHPRDVVRAHIGWLSARSPAFQRLLGKVHRDGSKPRINSTPVIQLMTRAPTPDQRLLRETVCFIEVTDQQSDTLDERNAKGFDKRSESRPILSVDRFQVNDMPVVFVPSMDGCLSQRRIVWIGISQGSPSSVEYSA